MKRVGVIGGGQLALMMGVAANKLGVELIIQTPDCNDPAVEIASDTVFAAVNDAQATIKLAEKCDVITFENEFVDIEALSQIASQGVCFRPRIEALSPLLDKYHQRCFLRDLGIPVPKFILPESLFAISSVNQSIYTKSYRDSEWKLSFPSVLKARRHGYDGQGTFIINNLTDLETKNCLNSNFLLEEFIPFQKELSIIAARSTSGKISPFVVVETQQEQQVCRRVIAPADISPQTEKTIQDIACTVLNSLQVVGIFAIELFLTDGDQVLVNEIAPRTHNSGHFSIDACFTSQFEQHLRAVCDLPLGNVAMKIPCAIMVNLLGYETRTTNYIDKRSTLAKIPGAYLHWYGKSESRPGRKLGHITVLLNELNRDEAMTIARNIESVWYSQ
ncbi:MAG: 5-(carboxyamino)imidazole ribonucleotide synthase [Richelia sp. RM2_1_2]|nr:5-(carboxyamino)imidazole ribonucleotide synthase [Richelia sp. SM1_7_0]NJN08967.1 5-(carboxyamino)imidazole ribonucleotide synthase [Richelia sp. RM1_1_1]NJO26643.1 5-(carboxyamino)imidazole ribonucleotide synthase [Richelia sp. SL_2_1]NJO57706.1 5-(carboxyamino)imidazole ribonucleotide synthase [Richelia sp. RM2_1_2]